MSLKNSEALFVAHWLRNRVKCTDALWPGTRRSVRGQEISSTCFLAGYDKTILNPGLGCRHCDCGEVDISDMYYRLLSSEPNERQCLHLKANVAFVATMIMNEICSLFIFYHCSY